MIVTSCPHCFQFMPGKRVVIQFWLHRVNQVNQGSEFIIFHDEIVVDYRRKRDWRSAKYENYEVSFLFLNVTECSHESLNLCWIWLNCRIPMKWVIFKVLGTIVLFTRKPEECSTVMHMYEITCALNWSCQKYDKRLEENSCYFSCIHKLNCSNSRKQELIPTFS